MAGKLTLAFPFKPAEADRTLLALPDGTSVTYETAAIAFEAESGTPGGLSAEARLEGVAIALSRDASALFSAIGLGASSRFTIGTIGLAWRDGKPCLAGGGAFSLAVPVNASAGPLTARTFHAAMLLKDGDVSLNATLDLDLDIAGGIVVSLEKVGLNLTLANAGVRAEKPFAMTAQPPAGGALDLDLGVIIGGGFVSVDEDAGQYAGAFAARLLGIGVTANGVVCTKPFLSMIAALAADFRPAGIELSFGFTLNAVGGLVGLNRGCDTEQLREGVRTGAIESLMFPDDPIRNAPRILADLGRFFPARDGQLVVAPMLELGWGKPAGMIAMRLALIVQAPDPLIQIAGVLTVEIPPGGGAAALIRIEAAFVGGVDPGRQLITFDASLIDSHLLFAGLEGDFALRFRYAGRPDFLVSAGGFFPRWAPPADLSMGSMRRLAVSIGNLGPVQIRMESYFAVTTNTIQHGAFMEISLGVDDFGVSGSLGYDVIVVLDPFRFAARIGASFRVEAFGETLCGIDIEGELTGPHPLRLVANGSFKILFVRISVPVDVTFGDAGAEVPAPAIGVCERIRTQLLSPGAITVERPRASQADGVRLREGIDAALAPPDGELIIRQSLVPLGVGIDRIGTSHPSDGRVFDIRIAAGGDGGLVEGARPMERFAPGQFFDLSEEQKLSRPAFEDHPAGVRIGSDGRPALAGVTVADFDTEAILIDSLGQRLRFFPFQVGADVNAQLLSDGVAALAKQPHWPPVVPLADKGERFGVVDVATGTRFAGSATAHEAQGVLAAQAAKQPGLRGRLRIVPMSDLDAA